MIGETKDRILGIVFWLQELDPEERQEAIKELLYHVFALQQEKRTDYEIIYPGVWTDVVDGRTVDGGPTVWLVFHPDGVEEPHWPRIFLDDIPSSTVVSHLAGFLRAVGYEGPNDEWWGRRYHVEQCKRRLYDAERRLEVLERFEKQETAP